MEALSPERKAVRRSFDRAAAKYDSSALLQREVSERMLERLDLVKLKPNRVLDAGSGTGVAAGRLRQRYKPCQVLELDLAISMLFTSRRKSSLLGRMLRHTGPHICADLERIPLAGQSVDLVWSNLALQWLDQPDTAFAEFRRVLKPGGLLMFSTFGPDTLYELRAAFASVDAQPHVNRFIDMHDLGDALARLGFAAPVMDMEKITLTYDDVRAVMLDLKAIGAHSSAVGRQRGMMGKSKWAELISAYETRRSNGRIPATFEIIYGHAWVPSAKNDSADTKVIAFHPRKV